MDDLRMHGSTGLNSSGAPSGGSRSFKVLQQLTDNEGIYKNKMSLFKYKVLNREIILQ